jgi:hypothetical protein
MSSKNKAPTANKSMLEDYIAVPASFVKNCRMFINHCTKPDEKGTL